MCAGLRWPIRGLNAPSALRACPVLHPGHQRHLAHCPVSQPPAARMRSGWDCRPPRHPHAGAAARCPPGRRPAPTPCSRRLDAPPDACAGTVGTAGAMRVVCPSNGGRLSCRAAAPTTDRRSRAGAGDVVASTSSGGVCTDPRRLPQLLRGRSAQPRRGAFAARLMPRARESRASLMIPVSAPEPAGRGVGRPDRSIRRGGIDGCTRPWRWRRPEAAEAP